MSELRKRPNPDADALRRILRDHVDSGRPLTLPLCADGLSARLVERAGFEANFLSGFANAAVAGLPDVEYLQYGELVQKIQSIASVTHIPLIVDGDTGYGNEMTVRRTVQGFARAGAAAIMIEDQVSPKRCGHTANRSVVSRETAFRRMQAVIDSRNEGTDIVVVARCDARVISYDECVYRARKFVEMGAEIIFPEGIPTIEELERFCKDVPNAVRMVNCLEGGRTPELSADEYSKMGWHIVAHPLAILASTIAALEGTLTELSDTTKRYTAPASFDKILDVVGEREYRKTGARYEKPVQ